VPTACDKIIPLSQKGGADTVQINKWNAIAAMAQNRVIGANGKLPWHLPKDMAWFRSMTEGQILVAGRKTLESMPILPQNTYLVLTRDKSYTPPVPNVTAIHNLAQIPAEPPAGRSIWICGGSAVYAATLPHCRYLYLTTIKQIVDGDTHFPPFADTFRLDKTLDDNDRFILERYKNIHHYGGHDLD